MNTKFRFIAALFFLLSCGGEELCKTGKCGVEQDSKCVDVDGDGSAVSTELGGCCGVATLCRNDPDDDDPRIFSAAFDICDGVDNDGDGEIDNGKECTSLLQCLNALGDNASELPPGARVQCLVGQCVVVMHNIVCPDAEPDCPCDDQPLACVADEYESIPAVCQT